ncbi:MAG: phosphoglycerate kinase [Candidatus Nanohaloarchaea archaeon]
MDLEAEKILLRTDLNLPLKDGEPQKTLRFEIYLETIEELSENGKKTVVMAHQGRPGRNDFTSLQAHSQLLDEELDSKVHFVNSILGSELQQTLSEMEKGEIAVLENIRLMSEELKNFSGKKHANAIYINRLAENFDLYVNDAFSVAHRSQASITGFPEIINSTPGPVMTEELRNCRKIRDEFDSGVLVLGGEKPSDLIGIIESKIESVDKILLGGIPGEVALMAKGHDLGAKAEWIKERELDSDQTELKELMDSRSDKFEIPSDLAAENGDKSPEEVEDLIWDIGSETAERYAEIIEDADSVLMKGPMGAFEQHPEGTKKILQALKNCNGFTVMGGGHTSSLVKEFGYEIDDFDHVSIAGGAFVRCVSGGELPAADALDI